MANDLSLINVNCVECNHQNSVDFGAVQELKFVKCENCGNMFNVFGVYKFLYDKISLCKKMVDVSVNYSKAKSYVETGNIEEKSKIETSLEKSHFQDMLENIMHDMIAYGDCFVRMTQNVLERLEPTDLEFKIDWINEPPARSYQQAIVSVRKRFAPFTEYDVNNILHFKNGISISQFRGESIFGFWLKDWYFLRDCAEMAPLLGVEGERYSGVRWFRDFKESSVLGAAGIPHELIFPWMQIQPRVREIETNRFRHDIDRRRDEISHRMERKLFPRLLNREYEYGNFPRLKWQT